MTQLRLVLGFALLAATAGAAPVSAEPVRPNIILVLIDDQGWTGTSVAMDPALPDARSDFHQTPSLERLAASGMTFSRGYSPAHVCAPSRQSIQLGVTPAQLRLTWNPEIRKRPPFETPSIAQVLKTVDPAYVTAHFGKWHMRGSPQKLGYDVSDGKTTNDDGANRQRGIGIDDDPKEMFSITDRALLFMQEQVAADRPFYLQVSHYAVHLGMETALATYLDYEERPPGKRHRNFVYAAMTADLDTALGRLLDGVAKLGIGDRTYIVFTSDNGARLFERDQNAPLRKGKFSFYEGGVRVPFVVAGPGVAAGSSSAVPVIGWDLLPTFADLAGDASAVPERAEGGSFRTVLEAGGVGDVARPRAGFVFHQFREFSALLDGDWKLVTDWEMQQLELYDLAADIGEQRDLASAEPERAERMRDQLVAYLDAVGADRVTGRPSWAACAAEQLAAAATLCRAELRCVAQGVQSSAAPSPGGCTEAAQAVFDRALVKAQTRAESRERTCRGPVDAATVRASTDAIAARALAGLAAADPSDRDLRAEILRAAGNWCGKRLLTERRPLLSPHRERPRAVLARAEAHFERACRRAVARARRQGLSPDEGIHEVDAEIQKLTSELVETVSTP